MKKFRVEFVFLTSKVDIKNLIDDTHFPMDLENIVTEHNVREMFAAVVTALKQTGRVQEGDEVTCYTFEDGSFREIDAW